MRAAWLQIDLDAYRANLRALAAYAGAPVTAIVKANGYGHGMREMARAAVDAGCPGVAVALPEEGVELRAGGQPGSILVMGLSLEDQASLLVEYDLEVVVSRWELVGALASEARRQGRLAAIHVKVDTGMTRVGVEPEAALDLCRRIEAEPGIRLAGVMTHFAAAEAEDLVSAREQWDRFQPLVEALRSQVGTPLLHSANSAAALWFRPARLDRVRGGLLTYGVPPAPRRLPFEVRPVASLKARVVQVKEVPPGRSVSYGGTWTSDRRCRLALLPIGYADGVPWALSNRGEVLLSGGRAPIRGRVCMDQFVVEVTDLPPVSAGDEAVLIGTLGEHTITAQDVADQADTISYEILTRFSARLPRLFDQ
jgi:alanine racemase